MIQTTAPGRRQQHIHSKLSFPCLSARSPARPSVCPPTCLKIGVPNSPVYLSAFDSHRAGTEIQLHDHKRKKNPKNSDPAILGRVLSCCCCCCCYCRNGGAARSFRRNVEIFTETERFSRSVSAGRCRGERHSVCSSPQRSQNTTRWLGFFVIPRANQTSTGSQPSMLHDRPVMDE